MKSIKELTGERADLFEKNKGLLNKAESEGRALNSEERSEYDKRDKEIDALGDEIQGRTDDETRKQRADQLEREMGRPLPRPTPGKLGSKADDAETLTFDFGRAGKLALADIAEEDERLASQLKERANPKYARAFSRYLRNGGNGQQLGLIVGDDSKGGYSAPMGFLSQLIKFLDDAVTVRRYATVLPPTTLKSVGVLSYDTDYADADWSAEVPASDISEDDAARFGQRELIPHLFSKLVKTSRKMLRNSSLAIESFVAKRLAYKFAITENKAYLTGDGAQQPLGMFVASNDGIPTTRDVTAASATTFTADELIDVQANVKDAYRNNGTWIVSRTFRKMARKLKDGNGQYLLTMNTAGLGQDTLLERPMVVDENAPSTFTTGQYIAIFGDLSFYYIQDGLDLEVQRADELFMLKNQVGWVGRKETDAMPVLAEAFSRFKLG